MSVSYDVMKTVLECVTSFCSAMHSHYDESECKIYIDVLMITFYTDKRFDNVVIDISTFK